MNPYERRIIHSALQGDKFVETHSEGDEPYRKVVVTLKKGVEGSYSSGGYHKRGNYRNGKGKGRYNGNRQSYRASKDDADTTTNTEEK